MGQRNGWKNIQIQAKQDFVELFEDTFNQSGANSKAEFLRTQVDNYLSPEESNTKDLLKLKESLSIANAEIEKLSTRLGLYEIPALKDFLTKHKGETLNFVNANNKKMMIVIQDLPDIASAMFNSFKTK